MTILFDRFLDDAAIFPPGNAPMEIAVRGHARAMNSSDARHVGPFVCSASRLAELGAALASAGVEVLDLTLVTPTGSATAAISAAHEDPRLRLHAVELSGTDADTSPPAVPEGTLVLIERPVRPPFDLPTGTALKMRTGGETADAFPSEADLAAAIAQTVEQDLRFKLTAGLHNAIRHTDPTTGFEHHGFLNIVLAVHEALDGSGGDLVATLAERDATTVAAAVADLDQPECGLVRSHFLSIGTCSIDEAHDDLRGLGLLEPA